MRYTELNTLLLERVVNLHKAADMARWKEKVWALLQSSYSKIGGFKSAATVDELIADSALWKMVTREGTITAIAIYKDRYGRKSIAVATDGTAQGKRDLVMLKSEDMRFGRAWAEVSGAPERMMSRMGGRPVPNQYAAALTGKEILSFNDDGYHYTRLIAGVPYEKIIYGFPLLTPELRQALDALGLESGYFGAKNRG